MTTTTEQPSLERLPHFVGLDEGVDAAAVLRDTKVLLPGIGSVGSRSAMHCGRSGFGELALVDGKRFKGNFATQALRSARDVGKPKASLVAGRVRAVAADTTVHAYDAPFESLPWTRFHDYDAALASTDNLQAEVEIGQRCLWLGMPLIYASVHGPTLSVQLRVFSNRDGSGPCPACAFSAAEWRRLADEVVYTCAPDAATATPATIDGPPTMSCSCLCSLAADLGVLHLLCLTLQIGSGLTDAVVEYNAYGHRTAASPLKRNPHCPCDHTVLERAPVGRALGECSLREIAAASGVGGDGVARAAFTVDGHAFVGAARCPGCGHEIPIGRFMTPQEPVRRRCPACGRPGLERQPFHAYEDRVPVAAGLVGLLDEPLKALGARPFGVVVRSGPDAVLVHESKEAA